MIEIVPASPAHVGTIANRMREIDRIECAINGHGPKEALRLSLRSATVAWTAKVDGRPEAMFGASTVCLLTGEGSPWFLSTPVVFDHARTMLVEGRRYSGRLQAIFRVLSNNVHADNHKSIRWLRACGYTVGEVFDMNGHPMRPFERRS